MAQQQQQQQEQEQPESTRTTTMTTTKKKKKMMMMNTTSTNLLIDQQHFHVVIEGFVNTNHPRAAEKATSLLKRMETTVGLKPNVNNYSSLMWTLARSDEEEERSKESSRSSRGGNGDHASAATTADAYAVETTSNIERMQSLFDKMVQQWHETGDVTAKPNEVTFHAILYGLANSSNPKHLEEAEALLLSGTMEQNFDVQPTVKMYNTLMTAWMKRRKADRVERLFQELKRNNMDNGGGSSSSSNSSSNSSLYLKPSPNVHTTRLQAWSKAGVPEKATEALREWISSVDDQEVIEDEENSVAPLQSTTTTTTTTLRNRRGKSNNDDDRHNDGNHTMISNQLPTTQAFNAILHAHLRSNRRDSIVRMEQGLQRMQEFAGCVTKQSIPLLLFRAPVEM